MQHTNRAKSRLACGDVAAQVQGCGPTLVLNVRIDLGLVRGCAIAITSHDTYMRTYITLHYITLHYITLHCIALHCIALHCIALHCITLPYITLYYIHYRHDTH